MRTSKNRRVFWQIASLAAAAVVLAFAARNAKLDEVGALVRSIGPAALLVPLPFFAGVVLHALATRSLFHVLGQRLSLGRLLSSLISTEAVVRSMPAGPAVSDAMSPALFHLRADAPIPDGVAVVAAKKCLIVLTNGVYVGLAVAISLRTLRALSPKLLGVAGLEYLVSAAGLALALGALGLAAALRSGGLAGLAHKLLTKVPLARLRAWLLEREASFLATDQKLGAVFAKTANGAARGGLLLVPATLEFVVVWLLEAAETWLILCLLGVDIGLREALAVEIVASLLRSLAFIVPAGLGVQDAGYIAVLGGLGVPDAPSVGVAFRAHQAREGALVGGDWLLALRSSPRWVDRQKRPRPATRRRSGALR